MYSNSELRAVALAFFQKTICRYICSIKKHNYSSLKSNRYINKLQNLEYQIENEISQIEIGVVKKTEELFTKVKANQRFEYISRNDDLKYFIDELNRFFEYIMDCENILQAEMIADIENQWFPDWILPTSTFEFKIFIQSLQSSEKEKLTSDRVLIDKLMGKSQIKKTLDFWNNKKKNQRTLILEEAVKAHLEGKFYLSVSTMIPQIEGLLRDAIESSGIGKANFYSMEPNHMKAATESLKQEWAKPEKNNNSGLLVLLEKFPDIIGNLYQEYKTESAIKNGLYRHGICHGLQTDFGTEKNSLFLILIIDRIIFFM